MPGLGLHLFASIRYVAKAHDRDQIWHFPAAQGSLPPHRAPIIESATSRLSASESSKHWRVVPDVDSYLARADGSRDRGEWLAGLLRVTVSRTEVDAPFDANIAALP